MGLDIYAVESGGHIHGSYSTLHVNTRQLALLYCGMPEYIGEDKNGNKKSGFSFFMHPFLPDGFRDFGGLGNLKLSELLGAVMLAGKIFPEIMLHSDCEGHYTQVTKCDPLNRPKDYYIHGNSDALLKELNILCYDGEFRNSKDEKIISMLEYTKELRHLVKNEIDNGFGIIEFR